MFFCCLGILQGQPGFFHRSTRRVFDFGMGDAMDARSAEGKPK